MSLPGYLARWRAFCTSQDGYRATWGGLVQLDDQPTPAQVQGLANGLQELWDAGQYPLTAVMSSSWAIEATQVTMLDGERLQGVSSNELLDGTDQGTPLPPSNAYQGAWSCGLSWRGGHPRWTIPGVVNERLNVGGSALLLDATVQYLSESLNAWLGAVLTPGFLPGRSVVPGVLLTTVRDAAPLEPPAFAGLLVGHGRRRLATVRRRNGAPVG